MSVQPTAERLAEIRDCAERVEANMTLEVLAHVDAQQAEIDKLRKCAQMWQDAEAKCNAELDTAKAEIDRLGILLDDEYRHQFARERDRKLRLEGARELVGRAIKQHFSLTDEYAYAQAPEFWMDRLREALAVQETLADMEAAE